MQRAENRRIRMVAVFTILYILLALTWWSILLYQKNQALFEARLRLHDMELQQRSEVSGSNPGREAILRQYARQRRMILGESIFILVSVMVGIWLMVRGFLEEIRINRQRRNFLFSVTHELKTPVAAIRLILDTFRRRPLPPEQLQKLTQRGLEETDRLQDTLENLLLAARLGHHYQPQPERQPIAASFREIIDDLRQQWPLRQIELDLQTPEGEGYTDWKGLRIILRNLVENALKYSEGNAPVRIRVQAGDTTVSIDVSDEGIGIPDAEKARVFDMFYRLGEESQRRTKGTGLGLFLVRELTQRNRGRIQLRDNTPAGTIFTLTFPLHYEAHPDR